MICMWLLVTIIMMLILVASSHWPDYIWTISRILKIWIYIFHVLMDERKRKYSSQSSDRSSESYTTQIILLTHSYERRWGESFQRKSNERNYSKAYPAVVIWQDPSDHLYVRIYLNPRRPGDEEGERNHEHQQQRWIWFHFSHEE